MTAIEASSVRRIYYSTGLDNNPHGQPRATRRCCQPRVLNKVARLFSRQSCSVSQDTRPSDISTEHARALLIGAVSFVVAFPHTVMAMVLVYRQLGETAEFKGIQHELESEVFSPSANYDISLMFLRGTMERLDQEIL